MLAKKRIADLLVDTLIDAGVKRVYGLAGDSLNGITDSMRPRDNIQWVPVRHGESAAFAAGAEAHLTGQLAVCAGSCGPGNLRLINNSLYDCHRSRVPMLAIADHVSSREIGSGYFQETHPKLIFKECSDYCELVSQPEQMPRVLEIAMQTALSRRGVSVIALPGDVALRNAVEQQPRLHFPEPKPNARPSDEEIAALAKILNQSKKITILGGADCAGAHMELIEHAGKLKAPIVHAMRGKKFIEYNNPFDVGMISLLRFSSGYRYLQEPHSVRQPLLLGRLFPRLRDRTRSRLSRLRNGRPVVRGEFDVLMRVAAHRSHALTDAIESCHQAGLRRPKHKGASRHSLVMQHRRRQ